MNSTIYVKINSPCKQLFCYSFPPETRVICGRTTREGAEPPNVAIKFSELAVNQERQVSPLENKTSKFPICDGNS